MTAPHHPPSPPARLERRTAWLIACAGLVLFLSVGQRHAFGLYMLPVKPMHKLIAPSVLRSIGA